MGNDILRANLLVLFARLKHGQHQQLAMALGVSPVTIARWYPLNKHHRQPSPKHLPALVAYFELDPAIDLRTTLLVAADRADVLTHSDRVHAAQAWIARLPPHLLRAYWPALARLLSPPDEL